MNRASSVLLLIAASTLALAAAYDVPEYGVEFPYCHCGITCGPTMHDMRIDEKEACFTLRSNPECPVWPIDGCAMDIGKVEINTFLNCRFSTVLAYVNGRQTRISFDNSGFRGAQMMKLSNINAPLPLTQDLTVCLRIPEGARSDGLRCVTGPTLINTTDQSPIDVAIFSSNVKCCHKPPPTFPSPPSPSPPTPSPPPPSPSPPSPPPPPSPESPDRPTVPGFPGMPPFAPQLPEVDFPHSCFPGNSISNGGYDDDGEGLYLGGIPYSVDNLVKEPGMFSFDIVGGVCEQEVKPKMGSEPETCCGMVPSKIEIVMAPACHGKIKSIRVDDANVSPSYQNNTNYVPFPEADWPAFYPPMSNWYKVFKVGRLSGKHHIEIKLRDGECSDPDVFLPNGRVWYAIFNSNQYSGNCCGTSIWPKTE